MKTNNFSRLLCVAATAFCTLLLTPNKAYAHGNDYLEQQKHYSVMATGQNVIHFVIPVYSYGASNDYYVHSNSYIYIDQIQEGNNTPSSESVTIAKPYSKRIKDDSRTATTAAARVPPIWR